MEGYLLGSGTLEGQLIVPNAQDDHPKITKKKNKKTYMKLSENATTILKNDFKHFWKDE